MNITTCLVFVRSLLLFDIFLTFIAIWHVCAIFTYSSASQFSTDASYNQLLLFVSVLIIVTFIEHVFRSVLVFAMTMMSCASILPIFSVPCCLDQPETRCSWCGTPGRLGCLQSQCLGKASGVHFQWETLTLRSQWRCMDLIRWQYGIQRGFP